MRKLEVAYIETGNTISVTLNGRFRCLSLNTDQGQKLAAAVKKTPQDLDEIADLADICTYITRHTFGRVTVDDKDRLRLDGKVVDFGLHDIILRLITEGAEVTHLTKFIENVAGNPDPEVAPHLYSFLQKGGMPITPDGCFHAFKKVDDDYRSFASGNEDVTVIDALGVPTKVRGRIPHPVGGVVLMDRADCNPNRDQTCSVGLHACSPFYLNHWYGGSGRLLIVKIDPKDVTAVPSDYNDAKLRCCRLEIVAEIPEEDARTHFVKAMESRYTPAKEITVEVEIDAATMPEIKDGRVEITGSVTAFFTDPEVLKAFQQRGEDVLELTEADEVFTPCEGCTCGADGGMTLEQAVSLGIANASFATLSDEYFVGDGEDGEEFEDVPEHLERAYLIAFSSSYTEFFELEPFYSQSAFDQGVEDAQAVAKQHLEADIFDADYSLGANFDEMGDSHSDAYASGFTIGYLAVFTNDEDHAEIAAVVDAQLEEILAEIAEMDEGDNSGDDGVVGD